MPLQYQQEQKNGTTYLVLTGSDTPVRRLIVPAEEGGLPVRVIGNHAFASHKELEEVSLPASVDTIRAYAFHDCASLKSLSLYDTVIDYYDGVIRMCDKLRDITIYVRTDNYRVLRSILNDSGELLHVRLLIGGGEEEESEVRLTFPDYVTVATDNTMARTIQFDISGAGLGYRECVTREAINYHEYDNMFNRLVIDDIPTCVDLVTNRLRYPHELSETSRDTYRGWLLSHGSETLESLTARDDTDTVRFLCESSLIDRDVLPRAIQSASLKGRTYIGALLSDYAHGAKGTDHTPEVFSL